MALTVGLHGIDWEALDFINFCNLFVLALIFLFKMIKNRKIINAKLQGLFLAQKCSKHTSPRFLLRPSSPPPPPPGHSFSEGHRIHFGKRLAKSTKVQDVDVGHLVVFIVANSLKGGDVELLPNVRGVICIIRSANKPFHIGVHFLLKNHDKAHSAIRSLKRKSFGFPRP